MEKLSISEIIKRNAIYGEKLININPYRIKILSNVTINQLSILLEYYLRSNGLNAQISIGNYDNILQDSYCIDDYQAVVVTYELINLFSKYPIFVEEFSQNSTISIISIIEEEIDTLFNNLKNIPVVIFNKFSTLGLYSNPSKKTKSDIIVEKLNEYLISHCPSNIHLVDSNTIIAKIGELEAVDRKMFLLSKTLYSINYAKEVVYSISSIIFRYTGKLKKAIIFDCDNTLWRGILGEDGEDGIDMSPDSKIGSIFHAIQQIASWLSSQGVIICLCSKNNFDDVEHLLNTHKDVALSFDKITSYRINWQDKATNLAGIASELNIGIDSLVFVDDSSFEISLINERLPEVMTLQVPQKIENYPNYLLNIVNKFFYLSGNIEDIEKAKQYKQQFQRSEEMKKFSSLDDYLSSLHISVTLRLNDRSKIERIAQLTQKTNQFNLTTIRYSESQIESFINDRNYIVVSFDVDDKFGSSGLTGVCILHKKGSVMIFDSFLMSCRIMGRNIEYAIISSIILKFGDIITSFEAQYIPTTKNKPVADYYQTAGFTLVSIEETGIKHYLLKAADYNKIRNINYILIKDGQN